MRGSGKKENDPAVLQNSLGQTRVRGDRRMIHTKK